MIQAGTMRAVIEIQSRDAGQDAMGQQANTWTNSAKQRARIVGIGGSEEFKGMQFNPEMTHQVTTRWIAGISPLNRIIATDPTNGQVTTLDILSVDYPERMTELITINCKERISESGDLDVG